VAAWRGSARYGEGVDAPMEGRDGSAAARPEWSDIPTGPDQRGEQLQQLHRLERIPTLATVTMGRNDLLAACGTAPDGAQRLGRQRYPSQLLEGPRHQW
jgi:hypothetical protein